MSGGSEIVKIGDAAFGGILRVLTGGVWFKVGSDCRCVYS